MTAPVTPQARNSEQFAEPVILGVDTHKDVHVAAVVTEGGRLLDSGGFPASAVGYDELLAWARDFGPVLRAGVEGTGSYGAGLCRHLRAAGVAVTEVNRPDRALRRRHGKSDAVDAEAAARSVISGRATTVPKAGDGAVEMLRLFKLAKDSAVKSRTQAINQLKSVLISADPALREHLAGLSTTALVSQCAQFEPIPRADVDNAVQYTLRLLARRIQHLTEEIRSLEKHLTAQVNDTAPELLQLFGVGQDSAATLLIAAGDNPERLASEASFAALCGTSPVEMSSGKTQRRRLNRGGNRQANAALFRVILTRLRCHDSTRDYLARRTAQGRTKREIIRCLKRYLARAIYKIIRSSIPLPTTATAA
ncbi:IS110 family transposase [Streptomyces sp. NBC_00203]|uniref:IS110 family transposase n=1 Tax=Streptomyces sp. NBC_00203 TaxID=2975680 RepID=UPI003249A83C